MLRGHVLKLLQRRNEVYGSRVIILVHWRILLLREGRLHLAT